MHDMSLVRSAVGPSCASRRLQNQSSRPPVPDMASDCCLFHNALLTVLALQDNHPHLMFQYLT